jgi:hypothetical protein
LGIRQPAKEIMIEKIKMLTLCSNLEVAEGGDVGKLYPKVLNLGKKLFSKETLRERAAIAVAFNSRPSGRSALFLLFLLGQISPRAVR